MPTYLEPSAPMGTQLCGPEPRRTVGSSFAHKNEVNETPFACERAIGPKTVEPLMGMVFANGQEFNRNVYELVT